MILHLTNTAWTTWLSKQFIDNDDDQIQWACHFNFLKRSIQYNRKDQTHLFVQTKQLWSGDQLHQFDKQFDQAERQQQLIRASHLFDTLLHFPANTQMEFKRCTLEHRLDSGMHPFVSYGFEYEDAENEQNYFDQSQQVSFNHDRHSVALGVESKIVIILRSVVTTSFTIIKRSL